MRKPPVLRVFLVLCATLGSMILVLNMLGFIVPLRAQDVDGYLDFAGVQTLEYATAVERLSSIAEQSETTVELVRAATGLFHAGIAHISPDDVRAKGFAHYGMRVPATENWVLFVLSYIKPDTYRDYEFCSYRRALRRGTGRCGQQSMALVSFLTEQGVETGFVALGGHAVATAKVDDSSWYLLDPDYGGVIPLDIRTAERNPASVLPYYWSSAARENGIHEVYAAPNRVKYGGPEARYARACPIESASYVAKWLVPVLMLVPLPLTALRRRFSDR